MGPIQLLANITFSADLDTVSSRKLLELGLSLSRQNLFAESAACFARVLERLEPADTTLKEAVQAALKNNAACWEAQQRLFEASQQLAAASFRYESSLNRLAQLLPENTAANSCFSPDEAFSRNGLTATFRNIKPAQEAGAGPVPGLAITCFGAFKIERNGERLELCPNRGGQLVLRYLAGHPVQRETADVLMGILWPEDPDSVARHKLQVAVSALRSALNRGYDFPSGLGYIIYSNGAYGLNPGLEITVDVQRFTELYREGKQAEGINSAGYFEEACRLYTGDFLVEDLYADWSQVRREQLNRMHLEMCGALAEHYLSQGRYEQAATWAACLLQENRCDEVAHRLLIRIYSLAGRRSEAVRQYLRCQQYLAEELGIEPMPETRNLFYELIQQ